MSWDAGAITGRLELDPEGFTHGMLEAEGLAKVFPAIVTEFMTDPLLGAVGATEELGDKFAEMFTDVAADAENMNLLSQKLGVPVEVFSSWAQLAKTINVAPEQFAMGLKELSQHVQEFLDTAGSTKSNELEKTFQRLGISADFLRDHLNEPMAIFLKMRDGVDGLHDSTAKLTAVTELFGGRQSALVPLLTMTRSHVQNFMDTIDKLGGITTAQEAVAAQSFNDLKVETSIAFEGMAKAAAVPILTFLHNHMNEIQPVLIKSAQEITAEFEKFFNELSKNNGQDFLALLHGMLGALDDSAKIIGDVIKFFEWIDAHPKTVRFAEGAVTLGGTEAVRAAATVVDPDKGTESKTVDFLEKWSDLTTFGASYAGRKAGKWAWNKLTEDDDSAPPDSQPSQAAAMPNTPDSPPSTGSTDAPSPAPGIPDASHASPSAKPAALAASGGVTINELHVHVTPDVSAQALGNAVKKKIAQAQAQANAAASMGGT